ADRTATVGPVTVGTGYPDIAGNFGTKGTDTVNIDTTNPSVVVDIVDATLSNSDNTTPVTFEFSEDVIGFTADDVTVVGGTLSNLTAIDGNSHTATFTADDNTFTLGSVTVGTGYTDTVGNPGATGADTVNINTLNALTGGPGRTLTFFEATTNALGSELWRLNGADGSVLLWADINPGAQSSFPGFAGFNSLNNALWFDATRNDVGT